MSIIRSQNTSIDGKTIVGKGVNFAPVWETAAGLITALDEASVVQIALKAVDMGDTILYTLASGTLPPGVFLTQEGILEGSSPLVDVDTDWTFTVRAADIEGMASERTFSLRVRDVPIPPRFVTEAGRILAVDEGSDFSFNIDATDDHSVIGYEIVAGALPSGASLNTSSGLISGTAPLVSIDTDFAFTVQITDNDSLQALRQFSIRVNNLNSPPLITTPAGLLGMFSEGEAISIRIAANDDNAGLQWSAPVGLPPGLTIDGAGVISGVMPSVTEDTTFSFDVIVVDSSGLSDRRTFSLIVRDANRPPIWRLGAGPIGIFDSGATISIDLSASDDAPGVAYVLSDGALPSGVTLGSNGVLSGTLPLLSERTEFAFQVNALDAGGLQATIAHTLAVRRHNVAPEWLTPPGNLSVIGGGQTSNIALEVGDESGSLVVFSLVGGSLPLGMYVTSQGVIAGQAPTVAGTVEFAFVVRATDIEGLSADRSFNLRVAPSVDRPPVWDFPTRWGWINVSEGASLLATLVATDPEGGSITYSLINSSLPSGLTLNASTGVISGRSGFVSRNTSVYPVFRATDANGLYSDRAVELRLRNDGPRPQWISSYSLGRHPEGQSYAVTLQASFASGVGRYFISTDHPAPPAGATLNANTGVLSGVMPPVGTSDRRYEFVINAEDAIDADNRTGRWFEIVTENVPILPIWLTDQNLGTYDEGAVVNMTLVASDTEGVPPVLSTPADLPNGLQFDKSSGVLSGTLSFLRPQQGESVIESFSLTALNTESGSGARRTQTFTMTVLNSNQPPVWQTESELGEFYDNETLVRFTLVASDPDATPVRINADSRLPSWASLDADTGVLSIQPPKVRAPTRFAYAFSARDTVDPFNFQQRIFAFTVKNYVAPAPVWDTAALLGDFSELASFSVNLVASPTDGTTVTYENGNPSWRPFPAFLTLSPSGQLSGTLPAVGSPTNYSFTVRARTSGGGTQSRTFSFRVLNDNAAPVWQTPNSLGTFIEGTPFAYTFLATDPHGVDYFPGTAFLTLPDYLSLNESTGVVSGTLPDVAENTPVSFRIGARDRMDETATTLRTFTMTIANAEVPPTWVSPPSGSLGSFNERAAVSFTLLATVAQGVLYSIDSSGITGLSVNQSTGVLSGTLPTVTTNTTQNVVIRAANAAQASAFALRTYALTVLNVTVAPTWQTPAGFIATYTEGAPVLATLVATDDEQFAGYEIVAGNFGSSGLNFDPSTGVISGTAPRTNSTSVTFNLTVRASDTEGATATRTFNILVNNSAPIWQIPSGSVGTFSEGQNVNLTLGVTSAIGPVAVSVISGSLPAGFSLSETGVLSGFAYGDVGTFNFTARALDLDGTTTNRAYSIRILDATVAPRWSDAFPPGNVTSTFNLGTYAEGVQVDRFFYPIDDEALASMTLVSGVVPAGLTAQLAGNGVVGIGGQVSDTNVATDPADFNFTLRLIDNDGATADGNFVIRIVPNNPPVWTTPSGSLGTFRTGAVVSTTLVATDPDGGAVSYTATGIPANLSLTPTGVLSGTLATVLTDTTTSFTVTARDSVNAFTERTFSIRNNALAAPVWVSPAALGTFSEGSAFSYQFEATDADGSVVSYARVAGSFPADFSLTTGGLLTGTTPFLSGGDQTFNFTLRATDNDSLVADRAFSLVVNDANEVPVWQTGSNLGSFNEGGIVSLTLVATDVDPVSYTLTSGTISTGLSLASSGVISGTLAGVAANTTSNFVVQASDGFLTSNRTFSLTVLDVNTVPVWQSPAEGSIGSFTEGATITFTFVATDDKGISAYSIASGSLPTGLSLTPSTGVVTGALGNVASDTTFNFVARATDTQSATADRSYSLTVLNQNQAPTWVTPAASIGSVAEGASASFTVQATDDGGSVTYTLVGGTLPAGLTLNSSTGAITGTAPILGTPTDFNFTIRASDGSLFTDRAFSITVSSEVLAISRSLRTRNTNGAGNIGYLERSFAAGRSSTNGRRVTISAWVKFLMPPNIPNAQRSIFRTTNGQFNVGIDNQNRFYIQVSSGNFRTFTMQDNRLDPAQWHHIVWVVDTDNTVDADRGILWVNGTRITSIAASGGSFANADTQVLSATTHHLNVDEGILAEVNVIDNQALSASAFGLTSPATGQWVPRTYTGTYGNNGFRLDFSDFSTRANLGIDRSGRNQTFTVFNYNVTATDFFCDSLVDVPSDHGSGAITRGNYPILNPLTGLADSSLAAPFSGGLQARATASNYGLQPASIGARSGRYYFEARLLTSSSITNGARIGWITSSHQLTSTWSTATFTNPGTAPIYGALVNTAGVRTVSGNTIGGTDFGGTVSANDVFMVAYDADTGRMWVGRQGSWLNGGDPVNNLNPFVTIDNGYGQAIDLAVPYVVPFNNGQMDWHVNFGQIGQFAYTPPTGFVALNTNTLPAPVNPLPSTYINASVYTGNGTSQTITTGFAPNILMIRRRSATGSATAVQISDSVRGNNIFRDSAGAVAETSVSNLLTFGSNGFTVGNGNISGSLVNNNNGTGYVSYAFRSDPAAGITQVHYTGDGTGARTISHDLGLSPDFMMVFARNSTTDIWTYGRHFQSTTALRTQRWTMSTAAAITADANIWNNTDPTSSVFSVGSTLNANGTNYVAYLFSNKPGFVHAYSAHVSTNGAGFFVYTGFRPRILFRLPTNAFGRTVYDTARNTSGAMSTVSLITTNGAEANDTNYQAFSNGYRTAAGSGAGNTYFMLAFADQFFKYNRSSR